MRVILTVDWRVFDGVESRVFLFFFITIDWKVLFIKSIGEFLTARVKSFMTESTGEFLTE